MSLFEMWIAAAVTFGFIYSLWPRRNQHDRDIDCADPYRSAGAGE